MPHEIANTFCEKLHQLGELVKLFLFKGATLRLLCVVTPFANH